MLIGIAQQTSSKLKKKQLELLGPKCFRLCVYVAKEHVLCNFLVLSVSNHSFGSLI